jgi:mycoredoxin-dependent peroxiredoxin
VGLQIGDQAPEFDLGVAKGERVRLADFRGRSNVLLVFHPYAWTAVCTEEALDLQENLDSFRSAETEVVFVSCDSSAARQAWKESMGAEFTFASDFWSHGAAARAYGVFDETSGTSVRGTFLINKEGAVIWSLVNDVGARREDLVPGPLGTLSSAQ